MKARCKKKSKQNILGQFSVYQRALSLSRSLARTHARTCPQFLEVLDTRSSEVFPSDGGEDGVDEVEECSNVGKDLKHSQTHLRTHRF